MTSEAPAAGLQQRLVPAVGLSFVVCAVAMLAQATLIAAWAVSLILTLCVALGAARGADGLGPFKPWLAAALLVWMGAFAGMHLLSPGIDSLVLGLPPATAVAIFILWLAPMLLVTLPYSLYFDSAILSEADLAAFAAASGTVSADQGEAS